MITILGIKINYKGKTPKDTIKINHKLYGSLHKYKGNCMNYTPGLLHNIKYVKLYNSCYFIPEQTLPEKINDEKQKDIGFYALELYITEAIDEHCFDLTIEKFELPEDEHFSKYIFKKGYYYWKDYSKDLRRVFRCKAKYRLDL